MRNRSRPSLNRSMTAASPSKVLVLKLPIPLRAKPRVKFNSTLHQSSHGFATRVHGFATKTKSSRAPNPASYAGYLGTKICGRQTFSISIQGLCSNNSNTIKTLALLIISSCLENLITKKERQMKLTRFIFSRRFEVIVTPLSSDKYLQVLEFK